MKHREIKLYKPNALLAVVRTPVFKARVVADKTRYQRRNKHRLAE